MAAIDYYMCDVCRSKCFYDAELNWEDRKEGKIEIYGDKYSLDNCGDIAAICLECSKTHKIEIVERMN